MCVIYFISLPRHRYTETRMQISSATNEELKTFPFQFLYISMA